MTDRELLEAAAKAAGFTDTKVDDNGWFRVGTAAYNEWELWDPLTDDGDALRLAVKLGLNVMTCGREGPDTTEIQIGGAVPRTTFQPCAVADRQAATRRAIVRAASELVQRT